MEQFKTIKTKNYLGETPLWCQKSNSLYWINCEKKPALFNYSFETHEIKQWDMPQRIGAIAFTSDDRLIIALSDGVYYFDKENKKFELIAKNPDPENTHLHEGKTDRNGNFFIGSLSKNIKPENGIAAGKLYVLQNNELKPIVENIKVSNGLAFSPDNSKLYFCDTFQFEVWVFDYDASNCSISNKQKFFKINPEEGMCDGASIDKDGGYWTSMFKGGQIRRYSPDGKLDKTFKTPVSQPTMLAFGGENYETAFLTTTYIFTEYDEKADISNGDLLIIDNLAQGINDSVVKL